MDDINAPIPTPIILGRLFLCTIQTKIDVSKGILTMEFDGELVHFNIFDIMIYLVTLILCLAFMLLIPLLENFLNLIAG